MPENQFGCRPGHPTAQALMRLMHHCGVSAPNEKQFGSIFYHFTQAYDRVPKTKVLRKMMELKIPPQLILLNDFLKDRTFQVAHTGRTTSMRQQRNGIPQGSSLSVLIWLIFVYDMPLPKDKANVYVDDTEGWAHAPAKTPAKEELIEQLESRADCCAQTTKKSKTETTSCALEIYQCVR